MPMTMSAAFRNTVVDTITGRSSFSTTNRPTGITFYTGAQAADPTTAPAGTLIAPMTSGAAITSLMSAPANGVSALGAVISIAGASVTGSGTVAFARIGAVSGGTPMIDVEASLAGGGGGVIVAALTASVGVTFNINSFTLKLNSSNGTVSINDALRDTIISSIFNIASVTQAALGASASINIYSGSAPASANAPATGTLLATFTTAAGGTSWGAAAGGTAALAATLGATGAATGTAGYARIVKGAMVLQGSVGTSGTDFVLDTTSITSGGSVNLTNASITF